MISSICQGQGSIQGTGTGTHILEVSKTSGGPWCGPTWKVVPILIHCFNALFSAFMGLSACMSNNDRGVRVLGGVQKCILLFFVPVYSRVEQMSPCLFYP